MNTFITRLVCGLTFGSMSFASADAVRLNDVDHLRRLSLNTRGHVPAPADFTALAGTDAKVKDAFLRDRAEAYVRDEDFVAKMTSNLSFLFRVAPPRLIQGNPQYTTLHLLFDRIVRANSSWDELLVSSTVGLTDQGKDGGLGGVDFFKNAAVGEERQRLNDYLRDNKLAEITSGINNTYDQWESTPGKSPSMDFKSPQVSGVLSDPHFNARFPTNPINQNRKRAAAVFRIFLCDEMQAVSLPDEAVQKDLDAVGFESKNPNPPPAHSGDIHADDPKCASCHYKLDPMANAFRGVSNRLPSRPGAGALTFKRRTGELVSVPFTNVRELGQALAKQPEYVSCQVRHFWDWFVGEDVVMDQRTETELVREFERVGRRPREFARYIVNRPEFAAFPVITPETITVDHVSRTLMDCTSCHATEKAAPDYRQMPFTRFGIFMPPEKTQAMHDFNLETMVETLDLTGDGNKVTMPPTNAGWRVGSDERARLLAWLANGARDENGRVTWNDETLRPQLLERLKAEKISFAYRASQGWTAKRRMSVRDLSTSLTFLAEQLGLPKDQYNYANGSGSEVASPINLTSGSPIKSVGGDYVKSVAGMAQNFTNTLFTTLNADGKLATRLGLTGLLSVSDDVIIRSLTRTLWGREAQPGTNEWTNLQNYVQTLSSQTWSMKVRNLAYQMIINDKFLVY